MTAAHAMSRIRYEIQLFCAALTFLTRIPLLPQTLYVPKVMAACCRYYPLVGVIVGTLLAAVFAGVHLLLPLTPSVVITLIAGALLTGAFHEDGLADTCDGLGGGWSREDALRIMKDSRVGSYALIGITLAIALKITLLSALPASTVAATLIAAHTLSRALALSYLLNYPYVQPAEHSKVGTYAKASITTPVFLLIAIACLLLTAWLLDPRTALACIVGLAITRQLFGRYLLRRLGGITGDCLGAAQQIGEVLVYAIVVALHVHPI
jgi:adenosylcobinamide-GDP ribazoletransferase